MKMRIFVIPPYTSKEKHLKDTNTTTQTDSVKKNPRAIAVLAI